MRTLLRRIVGWVAVYTLALQVLGTGLQPGFAGTHASFDPLSITCLNGDGATAGDLGKSGGTSGTHGCDHCVLCSTTPAPSAPAAATWIAFIVRPAGLALRAESAPPKTATLHTPDFPRGPPQTM